MSCPIELMGSIDDIILGFIGVPDGSIDIGEFVGKEEFVSLLFRLVGLSGDDDKFANGVDAVTGLPMPELLPRVVVLGICDAGEVTRELEAPDG